MALKPNSPLVFCLMLTLAFSGHLNAQYKTNYSELSLSEQHGSGLQETEFDEAYWREQVKDKTFDEPEVKQSRQKKQRSPEAKSKKQTDYSAYLWLIPVLLLLIIFLFKIVPLIRKRPELKHKSHIDYTTVTTTEKPAADDGTQALQTALQAGDYRLAFRLRYLGALRSLSDGGLITYRKDLSNGDYLQQLKDKAVYASFKQLTTHFNATWYGDQPTDEAVYWQMDQYFKQLDQTLSAF